MVQLPGAVVLCGCFLVAGAVATALWSLVQALLDLGSVRSCRAHSASAAAQDHLTRAVTASAVALLVAAVPSLLAHARLAALVLLLL